MTAAGLPGFYRLLFYESIDSTNAEAKRLAVAGASEGTLVWAGEQTAGRGRRGRAWQSPPGNLYLSLVLRPAVPPAIAAQVSFVAAVALAEALDPLVAGTRRVRLKWPNDVLVDGRKVSGILLEAGPLTAARLDWLILGVGVNLVSAPALADRPATSLREAGLASMDPAAMLQTLAEHLLVWLERWRAEGFAPIRESWRARASGFGDPVRVQLDREVFDARMLDLDASGALQVELAGGGQRSVMAGDVFFPQTHPA